MFLSYGLIDRIGWRWMGMALDDRPMGEV